MVNLIKKGRNVIDVKGHTALVTGSSKGVGRSIAIALAKAGANVLIHGRAMSDEAQSAIDECKAAGVNADFVGGDLSGPTEAAVTEVFDGALGKLPGVDLLVNNAGQFFDLPFLEMTLERFEKTMRLNVASAYFLTQRFANYWIERNVDGRVLMIGSINGRLAEPGSTGYDTSKGAIDMMVKTLAANLAPHNIRVNGLAPGLVQTPQTSWLSQREEDAAWMAHHTPNGKVPHSDVCGEGAVYLLSDGAWHCQGQMLTIDGGMSAWQQPERDGWRLER